MNIRYTVCALLTVLLTACGGGGGGGGGENSSQNTTQPNGWVAGQYESANTFKNRCVNPRSNSDYQDLVGTVTDENNWIRSWSHDTYLWYQELPDINPATINDPIDYFERMKTTAKTPSGRDKDQFHFTWDTEQYNLLAESGISVSYGTIFQITSPEQRVFVSYTEANSPADQANISRGAEILAVDGVYLDSIFSDQDVDTINNGLFPASVNETHTFVVRDLNASSDRSLTLTSAETTETPVYKSQVITQEDKNIAYLVLNTFGVATAEQQLINAINSLENQTIDELVLDLRYNGGGYLGISAELGTMIAGDQALNQVYEEMTFNDKHPNFDPVTGDRLAPILFPSAAYGFSAAEDTPLPKLNLSKVYILSTENTASASEALINGLRGIDVEVILIGNNTTGKPYGFYAQDNCGTTYFTIQFKGANAKGFGDYADGFIPSANDNGTDQVRGCQVADDLSKVLGDESENMLGTALYHIQNDSCPTLASAQSSDKPEHPLSALSGKLIRPYPIGLIIK